MLKGILQQLLGENAPVALQGVVGLALVVLVAAVIFLLRHRDSSDGRGFRPGGLHSTGAPKPRSRGPLLPEQDPIAHWKMTRQGGSPAENSMKTASPLSLPGIRIDGRPHEVLGVSEQASESEISSAYKKLMKQYHPDRVGRPGSREWTDAQMIAEAINRAKSEMLANLRQSPNPKRSGR